MLFSAKSRDNAEEGITEDGCGFLHCTGTAASNYRLPTIPLLMYYSMFGFQRVSSDMIWAFADSRGKGLWAGPLAARICEGPDHVTDSLKAKHRVVHVERNRGQAVIGVGRARGSEGSHSACFGNALLQNLAILLFAVVSRMARTFCEDIPKQALWLPFTAAGTAY